MTEGSDSFMRVTIIQFIMCLFALTLDEVLATPDQIRAKDECMKSARSPMKDDDGKIIKGTG
jgi:hypothetical protein